MHWRYRVLIALLMLIGLAFPEAPGASASPAESGHYTTHVVGVGETLYSIARWYGADAGAIAAHNGIVNPNYIYVGQRLTIPGSHAPSYGKGHGHGSHAPSHGGSHTVRLGETLYGIAAAYGSTVSALLSANGLANPNYIYVGQTLTIPGGHSSGGHGGYVEKPHHAGHPRCGYYYHVSPGESLSGIAWAHRTTVYAIARANGIGYPHMIYSGQSLHIPCDGGTPKHRTVRHDPPKKAAPHRAKKESKKLQRANCPREVQIVQPLQYEHVKDTIQIVGTATADEFWFYKVEYAMGHAPLDSAFASIGEIHEEPVVDGVLTTWYTGNMPAGAYTLRLTSVHITGNIVHACDVKVHIDH